VESLGYQPVNTNYGEHSLETRQKEVAVSMTQGLKYVYSFRITAEKGELRVEAKCEENSSLDSELGDCGDSHPKRVIEEMNTIYARILETAKTTEDPNVDWEATGTEGGEDVAGADQEMSESAKAK
jgi:hypothetical protein